MKLCKRCASRGRVEERVFKGNYEFRVRCKKCNNRTRYYLKKDSLAISTWNKLNQHTTKTAKYLKWKKKYDEKTAAREADIKAHQEEYLIKLKNLLTIIHCLTLHHRSSICYNIRVIMNAKGLDDGDISFYYRNFDRYKDPNTGEYTDTLPVKERITKKMSMRERIEVLERFYDVLQKHFHRYTSVHRLLFFKTNRTIYSTEPDPNLDSYKDEKLPLDRDPALLNVYLDPRLGL